jgi:hypothetical protein
MWGNKTPRHCGALCLNPLGGGYFSLEDVFKQLALLFFGSPGHGICKKNQKI